jgi:predicted SnoaL-like aldol condensation-catalyzing enzyme
VSSSLRDNKEIVKTFYDLIINKKDFESASQYMGKRYKQHNPLVGDGPEGLKVFIQFLKTNFPEATSEVKRIFAEGDYVILHVHSLRTPGTRGRAIIEIFRLEDGKIDEHWDVIQEVPEDSANPNSMF